MSAVCIPGVEPSHLAGCGRCPGVVLCTVVHQAGVDVVGGGGGDDAVSQDTGGVKHLLPDGQPVTL